MVENQIDKFKLKSFTATYASKVSQQDLSQLVHRVLHPLGRYQKFLIVILCFNSGIIAFNNTVTTFYIYTPKNYSCSGEPAGNSTCVAGCTEYEFNDPDSSIVTEWSLVCDRRYLSALINTMYFAGFTVGSLVTGVISDYWGRRKLILTCLYLQGIVGGSLYLSTSVEMFMGLRFLQGLLLPGLQSTSYMLLQELTPTRKLTMTGILFECSRSFGLIFLGVTAYFIRDWRNLQLVMCIPTLLTVAWSWAIPESPKWLLSKDKKLLALRACLRFARKNKDEAFIDEYRKQLNVSKKARGEEVAGVEESSPSGNVLDLFRNRILLKHILIAIVLWFGGNWAYYGMLYNIPSLPGGRHLNFLIGTFIEVAGVLVAFFLLTRLGRRITVIVMFYTITGFYLAFGFAILIEDPGTVVQVLISTFALVGKGLATGLVGGIHIFVAELFPTYIRTSANGIGGFSGRFGSLSAPQLILLGEMTHLIVAPLSIAILLFIGGSITFFLPETINKKLPDTLAEVNESWGKKKGENESSG